LKKIFFYLFSFLILLFFLEGCFVKRERVKLSVSYKNAKTLSRDEVLSMLKERSKSLKTLLIKKGKFRFIAISKKVNEKYPTVRGLLIADFKKNLRLQIFAPVVKSCVFDLLQKGDKFQIWYPKKRILYVGSTGKEIKFNALLEDKRDLKYNLKNIRPSHLYDIFFLGFDCKNLKDVLVEEFNDRFYRYYMVTETGKDESGNLIPLREYFVERSTLQIVKKKIFDVKGRLAGVVNYYNFKRFGDINFPTFISLERERDGYRVEISLKEVLLNEKLPEKSFILKLPRHYKIKKLN